MTYTDTTYQFSVEHPATFVVQPEPPEKLAPLEPRPAASVRFLNPGAASSDIAELEAADLEIRVHIPGQIGSLKSWLESNGLLPADGTAPPKPFETAHVSGVEVCATTMIAPGCSYFVLGNGRVYQLIPATVEGEGMMKTFRWS